MAFLKRMSNSFWDYVSPRKNQAPLPTPPKTDDVFKMPPKPTRTPSMREVTKNTRSMSPIERVHGWRVQSPASRSGSAISSYSNKRKRLYTPGSSGAGRRSKYPRIEVDDDDFSPAVEEEDEEDVIEDEEDLIEDEPDTRYLRTPSPRQKRTPSPSFEESVQQNMSPENTLLVDDDEYANLQHRRKMVSLPEELGMAHIATDELRSQGFDDDYITLIQKIGLRGYEPVLPAYMKFEFNFLPDGLFEGTDDAFVGSLRQSHFRASKALQKLFDLGGHVRDRKFLDDEADPEEEVRKHLNSFIKWAEADADIDKRTAIPILVQEYQPGGTPAEILKSNAEEKCRRLAARYKEKLRVLKSIETSPGSRSSHQTMLSYELPTFYAVLASYTIIAVMAYRPDTDELTPIAYFDYKDKDYDVWNSLALAIVVCHVRNVQLRIADETLIGQPLPSSSEEDYSDDPDA